MTSEKGIFLIGVAMLIWVLYTVGIDFAMYLEALFYDFGYGLHG